MFLIFGLRAYFRTIGQGTFHCQCCGGDRRYTRRAGRRWFHLFFIPVIPLVSVGEHVMCSTCHTAYHVDVLALPTAAQMQAALPAGLRAAAAAMLRTGDPDSPAARRRAIDTIRRVGPPGYDDAALDGDLAGPAAQAEDTAGPLNRLALQLAVHAREWFLADVVRIGLADGPLSENERHAARQIAADLAMTAAQAHGVISMTEESATAE
jgi:hypothetical protein